MARRMPLIAQARVALASGAPLTVVAWVSAVAALYLFAGAGAWAAGFTASGEVLGFLPDPAYAAGVSGCGAAEAIAVAALAHAAVLPVAAVAVAYLVLREGFSSGAAALIAASLACLAVASSALLGVGPVAATAVIVLAVAGLVSQMSGAPVPTHMGALAVACGIGTASQLPAQALFAVVTAAAELTVALAAIRKRA